MKKMMSKVMVGTLVLSMAAGLGMYTDNLQAQGALTKTSTVISESKAKKIALKHAKLTEAQVSYVKVEMDNDDGRTKYEIEFYRGNKEYDYDIDARTGAILGFDNDVDGFNVPRKVISSAKAKKAALKHAGLTSKQITYIRAELEYDDTQPVYEIEFYRGDKEYDYEISAITGKVVSFDNDVETYTSNENLISRAQAQKIACDHAGIKDTKVVFVKSELEYDDGAARYDIDFYIGNKEYDYEIDAVTGKILEFDSEVEDFSVSEVATGKYISKTKASNIAVKHAGLSTSKVNGIKVKMEFDDGRMEYEVDFYSGSTEYEYKLDATTGKILGYESDQNDYDDYDDDYDYDDDWNNNSGSTSGNYITEAKAKDIALKHAGLSSSNVYGLKVSLDHDDNAVEYEIEFKTQTSEYEYTIDAVSGKILDYDKDYND